MPKNKRPTYNLPFLIALYHAIKEFKRKQDKSPTLDEIGQFEIKGYVMSEHKSVIRYHLLKMQELRLIEREPRRSHIRILPLEKAHQLVRDYLKVKSES